MITRRIHQLPLRSKNQLAEVQFFAGELEENDLATNAFVAFIHGIGALTAYYEKTLSHSHTAESENTVISRIGKFLSVINQIFEEIGRKLPGSTVLYSDNQAAIVKAKTPCLYECHASHEDTTSR